MYRTIIVDDEVDISRGMTTILNWGAHGFEITGTAENGRQALALFERVSPHFVITDIRMPLMDGLELTRSLKERSPDLKVMLLSGYSDFAYAKEAIRFGVSNYLLKPVDVAELEAELLRIKRSIDSLNLSLRTRSLTRAQQAGPRGGGIGEILAYIGEHCAEELTLNRLGEVFYLNPFYIGKLIKKECARTFNEYLNDVRIENAKYLLRNTSLTVGEIGEQVGYKFPDHFYRNFKKHASVSPGVYRESIKE